jgi:hypothetical protein
LTFIVASISPEHFAVSVSKVALVVSLKNVAISPSEDTIPPFFVILILTLVLVRDTRGTFPETLTGAKAVGKVTLEVALVFPVILPVTTGCPVLEKPLVNISVHKLLNTLPMLKGIFILALVSIAIFSHKHSVPLRFADSPFSHICLSVQALPESFSLFDAIIPFSFVHLFLGVSELSSAVRFVVVVVTVVGRTVWESLKSYARFFVIIPLPLINSFLFAAFFGE